ncbi:HNH endonuclease [Methanobrevibacter sp.]|uniref:HNH endonuclease n=1 Tax=Methanobrevibacter sp. TaxID=66852 RepID=UPI00386A3DCE
MKEGNKDKLLHRLIYEDYIGTTLDKGMHVHHKNRNKLDNCVLNLEALTASEHISLHRKGVPLTHECRVNISKAKGSSNYFRVTIEKDPTCKQGFIYRYQYSENNKRKKIKSVNLEKLKEKVLDRGLEWIEFN